MSSHWRSSRWSSAREREAREKSRADEREQRRGGGTEQTTANKTKSSERAPASDISDLISSSTRRPRERKWPHPEQPKTPDPEPEPVTKPVRRRSRRKTATTAKPAAGSVTATPLLPNLPDEPAADSSGGKGRGPNRPLIFGLLLFVMMAVIAFIPTGLIPGTSREPPAPTQQSMIVPTALDTPASDNLDAPTQPGQTADPAGSRGEIVCIDPGHGGWDSGGTRPGNERAPALREADINLGMGWMLKERLEDEGFTVVMTRESASPVNIYNLDVNGDGRILQNLDGGDQDGDRDELQARINVCNDAQADILISLHINSYDPASVRGYEVIYTDFPYRPFGAQNRDLAYYVYTSMQSKFDEIGFETTGRNYIADHTMDVQTHEERTELHMVLTGPGANAVDFTLTPSQMPGIICEAGFITNDADAAFLADPENQQYVVDAYAEGIIQYFDAYPGPFPR